MQRRAGVHASASDGEGRGVHLSGEDAVRGDSGRGGIHLGVGAPVAGGHAARDGEVEQEPLPQAAHSMCKLPSRGQGKTEAASRKPSFEPSSIIRPSIFMLA